MPAEKVEEHGYSVLNSDQQPELNIIIEKLKNAINRYDAIVLETRIKLQMIKNYNESVPLPIFLADPVKDNKPKSATEEINNLLLKLCDLNEKAGINLRHLREII